MSDPDKSVAKAFGCLNPRGMASRWTYYIGKDGKVLFVDKSVNAADHGADIVAKLTELGIDKSDASES